VRIWKIVVRAKKDDSVRLRRSTRRREFVEVNTIRREGAACPRSVGLYDGEITRRSHRYAIESAPHRQFLAAKLAPVRFEKSAPQWVRRAGRTAALQVVFDVVLVHNARHATRKFREVDGHLRKFDDHGVPHLTRQPFT